eukprot:gene24346-32789_t
MKSPLVHGVETNAASRFIDHTQATPWESLVSDIEKGIKVLQKRSVYTMNQATIEIFFLTLPFSLRKIKNDSFPSSSLRRLSDGFDLYEPNWLSKTFDINGWYLLFQFASTETHKYPTALQATVFSAFMTALRSIEAVEIPVFFTYAYATEILALRDVIGFATGANKKLTSVQDSTIPCHFKYESTVSKRLNSKHFLYFFDGLRKVYESKLSDVFGDYQIENYLKENSHALCKDMYLYSECELAWLYRIPPSANPKLHTTEKNNYFSSEMVKAVLKFVEHSNSLGISSILIEVQYREQKQVSIIDNLNYTTLIPSKQLPSSWRAAFNFDNKTFLERRSMSLNALKSDQSDSSGRVVEEDDLGKALWMSTCIRRLLVLFILSQCGKDGCMAAAAFDDPKTPSENLLDSNMMNQVKEVLSTVTKELLVEGLNDSKMSNSTLSPTSPSDLSRHSSAEVEDSATVMKDSLGDLSAGSIVGSKFQSLQFLFNTTSKRKDSSGPIFIFEHMGSLLPIGIDAAYSNVVSRSEMGNWMSVFAILCGCVPYGAKEITHYWFEVVRKLHESWSEGVLFRKINWQKGSPETSNGPDDSSMPVYKQSLWIDALARKQNEGVFVTVPDCAESIILQKMQMIHFCTVMKEEDPFVRLVRPAEEAMNDDITIPELCRRLPLTEDKVAIHEHVTKKISNADVSRSSDQVQYSQLRLQIQIPSLVSDMRAFKEANPTLPAETGLRSFCGWYGLLEVSPTEYSDMLPALESLWNSCEGVSCRDQKPLFHAENEAEKSLEYLESVTLSALSCELLSSGMRAIFHALHVRVSKLLSRLEALVASSGKKSREPLTSGFSVIADLELLYEHVQTALSQLKEPFAQKKGAMVDIDKLRNTVILIDSIAGLAERVEEYAVKVDEIETILIHFSEAAKKSSHSLYPSGSSVSPETQYEILKRLVLSLGQGSSYRLQCCEEVSVFMELIKSMAWQDSASPGGVLSGKHVWHSIDGRELGMPTAKSFSVRLGSVDDTGDPVGSSYKPYGTPFGGHYASFRMDAEVIKQDELRISFVLPEDAE